MTKAIFISLATIAVVSASCAKADDTSTPITQPGTQQPGIFDKLKELVTSSPSSCHPSYDVKFYACKQTSNIIAMVPVTLDKKRADSGSGLCRPSAQDEANVCNNERAVVAKNYPGTVTESITVTKVEDEKTDSIGCGDGFLNAEHLTRKTDVYCSYSFKAPLYEKVADESVCPVQHVNENAGCFASLSTPDSAINTQDDVKALEIHVNADDISSCINLTPHSPREQAIKDRCMNDIKRAYKSGRLKTVLPEDERNSFMQQLEFNKLK